MDDRKSTKERSINKVFFFLKKKSRRERDQSIDPDRTYSQMHAEEQKSQRGLQVRGYP